MLQQEMAVTRSALRHRRSPAKWVAVLLPLIVLSGCGMFSIREPTPPPSGGIREHYPNDPDSVLQNLVLGMDNKEEGIVVMRKALADSFKFELDPLVAPYSLSRTETENGWLAFLNAGVGADSVSIFFDTAHAAGRERPDNTTFYYDELPYLLKVLTPAGSVRDTLARGKIDLYFKMETTGTWAISLWIDKIADSEIPSLGSRIESGSGHPTGS